MQPVSYGNFIQPKNENTERDHSCTANPLKTNVTTLYQYLTGALVLKSSRVFLGASL